MIIFLLQSYHWLLVRDGDSKDAPIIGDKLCGTNIPQLVTASGSELYLEFHSDQYDTRKGFQLIVKEGSYHIINSSENLSKLLHNILLHNYIMYSWLCASFYYYFQQHGVDGKHGVHVQ